MLNKITKVFIILTLIAIPLFALLQPVDVANAVNFNAKGYANEFMSGDTSQRGFWGSDLYTDQKSPVHTQADNGAGLSEDINDFFVLVGRALIIAAAFFAAVRLAWRGIWAMVINDGDFNQLPKIFWSHAERKSKAKAPSPYWVREMLLETGIFLLIALAAGTMMGVVVGLAQAIMNVVMGKAPADYSTFQVGSLSVGTTK